VQQGSERSGRLFRSSAKVEAVRICDIAVDNVSALDSYRTEFQRIIGEKGFYELMTHIQRRDPELASTLGEPTHLPF
jgi:hypothetical protein